jgi:hypothetical protein
MIFITEVPAWCLSQGESEALEVRLTSAHELAAAARLDQEAAQAERDAIQAELEQLQTRWVGAVAALPLKKFHRNIMLVLGRIQLPSMS